MAKLKDGVITTWNGVVDAEMKDGNFVAYVKTDEQVRAIVMELVCALKAKIRVDKVILTGKYAKGCADEWDDIEVVVVSPDYEGMRRIDRTELTSELAALGNVHFIVGVIGEFTPDEYLAPEHTPMLGWRRYSGKVIYERSGD